MGNERKTESFVDNIFRNLGYTDVNYQGSENKNIQSLLKSKAGNKKGKGKPEYTILLNGIASDVLIIECKAEKKYHSSDFTLTKNIFEDKDIELLHAKDYAEDGVIHYMASVKEHYNVVGVAISGQDENNLEITTFISDNGKISRTNTKTILNAENYVKLLKSKEYKINEELIITNIKKELPILHNELRDKMKLSEQDKPLFISSCLLALQDNSFKNGFKNKTNKESLAKYTYDTIQDSLENILQVPEDKVKMMMSNFMFLHTNPNVKEHLKYVLEKVCFLFESFVFAETSYDIIGNFYNEFMRYTGGDAQGLGIVLTPKHITDLFCELADVDRDSVVLDTCTGTGAFLISAMKYMISLANNNPDKIAEIKKHQLVGIEQNPQMFTLACSNMILRHDGKSNMFNGSCFDSKIKNEIIKRNLKPTACLINPPYSQKDANESELAFIKNALDMMEKGGKLVAIIPISCAIEMSNLRIQQRRDILEKHTLEAVFSMPDELFYPVGTVTCVVVFTANKPHGVETVQTFIEKGVEKQYKVIQGHKPTYFGYWKDDGFVKTKTNGRCDKFGEWDKIKKEWIENYRSSTVINGKSAKEKVNERMEWCCEAYMSIDYSNIVEEDFEQELKKYLAFEIINKKV